MTERVVVHADFTIERRYDASPARVFAAFADPVAKRHWSACHDEGGLGEHMLDFREGGRETMRGTPAESGVFAMKAIFQEIVPEQRIIYSYELLRDDVRLSISLATIEFQRDGAGTSLRFTEQAAFLDGHDRPEWREQGSRIGFDRLADYLAQEQAPA